MMFYPHIRPFLFRGDPEQTHERVLAWVESGSRIAGFESMIKTMFGWESPLLQTSLWGQQITNPVGLAAGFDKDARIFNQLFALGFGLIEVGTVTPRAQEGNPKPRIFRLMEDRALINRLGFNNAGVDAMAGRLQENAAKGMLGINIGKNKDTPLEKAHVDYVQALNRLHEPAGYFTLNISSPNTENLRRLQEEEALERLLDAVCGERERLEGPRDRRTPLLVKLAPDWEAGMLLKCTEILRKFPLQGVIATNTTLDRHALKSTCQHETGGLSGAPLRKASLATVRLLFKELGGAMPVIGVGGIFNGRDAYETIRAGASAVQVYTALIYEGPGLVRAIKQELVKLLLADEYSTVSEAVGADVA